MPVALTVCSQEQVESRAPTATADRECISKAQEAIKGSEAGELCYSWSVVDQVTPYAHYYACMHARCITDILALCAQYWNDVVMHRE